MSRWQVKQMVSLDGKDTVITIAVLPGEVRSIEFVGCTNCPNFNTWNGAIMAGWGFDDVWHHLLCNDCIIGKE